MAGITETDAAARLQRDGYNELPSARPRSVVSVLWEVVREPMVGLLVVCGGLYLAMGEAHEAIPLLLSILFVVGIGLVQELKAERALEALRELASPRALVVRDGRERRIPGREVVVGDLIVLREGDRIAADGEIVEAAHLKVDESLLTGESVAVRKGGDAPGAARVLSASLVVAGQGLARVVAIGERTEIGRIGKSLEGARPEPSRLSREVQRLVWRFGALGLGASLLVTVAYGLTRGDWLRGALAGIAAAMALLPEEFPLVLTIFLAMGAWRLSRIRVLTRTPKAIETLGSITTLCVDKTGTLTWNRMSLVELRAGGATWRRGAGAGPELPETFHGLVEFGVLASHVDAFDPIDRAVRDLLDQKLAGTEHVHADWELVREYPLSPELLAMSCVWKSRSSDRLTIAAKGAPEAIADLCHLEEGDAAGVRREIEAMSRDGLRVLGVARAEFRDSAALPAHPHDFEFSFVGLLGFEDPLRDQVPAAIQECRAARIRVVMITGDHPETAKAIARRAGFEHPERVLTGAELEGIDDAELPARIRETEIFARVVPAQKLRIVNALKAHGDVVAMTGDGVNDAPALKWADVGISMGERGTDVAREASDLVLLDDDFSSIVAGIRMGRRVYDNLVSAMVYVLAIHVPIAGMAILPVALKLPLVLFPAHIVFLELIIDPASTLLFEGEGEADGLMSRPPRPASEETFSGRRILGASLQGLVALLATGLAFFVGLREALPEAETRSLAFSTLTLCNLALIFANRPVAWGRNPRAWWIVGGALLLLVAVQRLPYLRRAFQLDPLQPWAWLVALGCAAATFGASRALRRRRA